MSAKGISVGTDRVEATLDVPKPTTLKQLRSITGDDQVLTNMHSKPHSRDEALVSLTRKKPTGILPLNSIGEKQKMKPWRK